ncbi:MAG: DNA helicase, partial [Thiomargarita sp.]|nr:DNA helicase [Thiomargarita sp.]
VKAIRWASDRIEEEGIVALVTNNGFLDNLAFDGMRKHLEQDFSSVYVLDLGGNVRKNPGKTSNVFDIMVGVSINLFIKSSSEKTGIFYCDVGDTLKKQEKLDYLIQNKFSTVKWKQITPNKDYTWLTEGLHAEFDDYLPLGSKKAKRLKTEAEGVIFKTYSLGVSTHRDAWAYNFNEDVIVDNIQRTIDSYNEQVDKWIKREDQKVKIDSFVEYDDKRLSWGESLKIFLKRGQQAEFDNQKIRRTLYRPFTRANLYFDRMFNERVYLFPSIFPTPETEQENLVICFSAAGNAKNFQCLMTNVIPDLHLTGDSQCFPFYTYTEDGSRTENITNWCLEHYKTHYKAPKITKIDIFYAIYAILHQPHYRTKY